MGFLQKPSQQQSSKTATSGGFLQQSGTTSLTQAYKAIPVEPVAKKVTTPAVSTKPIAKTTQDKAKGFLSSIGESLVAGSKTLPSMAKIAGGVVLESIAQSKKKVNAFFEPAQKLQDKFIPLGSKTRQAIRDVESRNLVSTEKLGKTVRESGYSDSQKVAKENAEKITFSEGWQGLAEKVAYNAPIMLGSTGLTVATFLVTRNPIATSAVGLTTGYGLGASEVYSKAREQGMSDKQALPAAQLGGVILGAIENIPGYRLIKNTPAGKIVQKSLAKKLASGIVSFTVQSGLEGGTEWVQEVVGNAISQVYKENKDYFKGTKESFIIGTILGGVSDVTVSGASSILGNNATAEQVRDDVENRIDKAIATPKNKRTVEQQQVVDTLLTQTVTPDEALSLVVDTSLQNTDDGKKIVLASQEARASDQHIRLTQDEETGAIDIMVVDPNEQFQSEADATLLKSDILDDVEKADTPQAQETREALIKKTDDIQQTQSENEAKRAVLERFSSEAIKAMRIIKRSIESLENKGLDPTNVSKTKSYQVYIEDVMSELNTDSEDEAIRFIREELPDPITPATSRVEAEEIKVLKSRIEPKEVSVPRAQLPVGQGKLKVSTLEARMKGVLGRATQEQIDNLGLSTFNTMNKKENITKAAEYVLENPQEALAVLQGNKEAPEGILKQAIYVALTQMAKGDLTLATKLASIQATRLGQELSILTELDPNSPVKLMAEVIRVREAVFKKKFGGRSLKEVSKSIEKQIKEKVKKPDKYDWNNFISALEC